MIDNKAIIDAVLAKLALDVTEFSSKYYPQRPIDYELPDGINAEIHVYTPEEEYSQPQSNGQIDQQERCNVEVLIVGRSLDPLPNESDITVIDFEGNYSLKNRAIASIKGLKPALKHHKMYPEKVTHLSPDGGIWLTSIIFVARTYS